MSWATTAIGDIFQVARGGSPRPIDKFITDDPDGLNWVMIGDATASGKVIKSTKKKIKPEGLKKTRTVAPGDFILSNSMSFGRPYIMGIDGCIHDGWLLLRPQSEEIDPGYFYHLLGSPEIYAKFASRAAGATVKNLNSEIVRNVEVPLPPLGEQKRIAAILDQADVLRRLRQRTIDRLNTLGQAIFLEMFGDPRLNPFNYPKSKLGNFADSKLGKMLDKGKVRGDRTLPYLRNANVRWFEFDLSDVFEMEFFEKELERFRVQEGDLLICEGGEPGRCSIWRGEVDEIFYQKALHRVRVDREMAIPEYIEYWFFMAANLGMLSDTVTSATIAHLTGAKLKNLEIALPPVSNQMEFATKLEKISKYRAQQEAHSDVMDRAFSSLESRAFRGEL